MLYAINFFFRKLQSLALYVTNVKPALEPKMSDQQLTCHIWNASTSLLVYLVMHVLAQVAGVRVWAATCLMYSLHCPDCTDQIWRSLLTATPCRGSDWLRAWHTCDGRCSFLAEISCPSICASGCVQSLLIRESWGAALFWTWGRNGL